MVSKHNTGTEGTGSASQWRLLNEAVLVASVYGGLMLGFLFFLTVHLRGSILLQGREKWKENWSQTLFSSWAACEETVSYRSVMFCGGSSFGSSNLHNCPSRTLVTFTTVFFLAACRFCCLSTDVTLWGYPSLAFDVPPVSVCVIPYIRIPVGSTRILSFRLSWLSPNWYRRRLAFTIYSFQ